MAKTRKRGTKWQYEIYVGLDPITKKEKRISKSGFKTEREAKAAARLIELEIANGSYIKESNMSFETFAQEWLKYYRRSGVKANSIRLREKEMKHFSNVWDSYPINGISKKMYLDRIYDLSNSVSRNYLRGIHACGKLIFRYAAELGLIKINPTENVQLPKQQLKVNDLEEIEQNIKFLEKDELALFLNMALSEGLEMDYLIFSTLAYSGLRINELLALKWPDINVHECSLRVTKQIYNPNNKITGYQLETPKTTGSIRTIKIDEKIIDLLKKHRIHQNKIKLKNHMIYQDHGFIFARNDGHPLLRKVVVRRLERLLKKANIDKPITLHGFRHTHCSLLIEARVNMRVIQERLGHESISTTEKTYSHLTANLEKEASQKFSELMNSLMK